MSEPVTSPTLAISQELAKMKIHYLCCDQGGLHEGEQLNFICLDPKCRTRGLICPVCRQTTHQNHQTLHLKLFLTEIHQKVYQSEEPAQAGGLTSHLVALNESRKELISNLKDLAKQIAGIFRQIEQSIEASYTSVRRMVLGQANVMIKLPQLYEMLTTSTDEDPVFIRSQIRLYSELLEYKNSKLTSVDSASKLVEQYEKMAKACKSDMATIASPISFHLSQVKTKVQELPSSTAAETKPNEKNQSYKFSPELKSPTIKLDEAQQVAEVSKGEVGGYVFLSNALWEKDVASLNIRVKQCSSSAISLGIGSPAVLNEKGYLLMDGDHEGLFGFSAIGLTLNDYQSAFLFGAGDIIEIRWNRKEAKLTFSRRNALENFSVQLSNAGMYNDLKFFVSLVSEGDIVEIVE